MTQLLVISCLLIGFFSPKGKCKNEIEIRCVTKANNTTFEQKVAGFITICNFPNLKVELSEDDGVHTHELKTLYDNLIYFDDKLRLTRLVFETFENQSNVKNFKLVKRERYLRQYGSKIYDSRITFENENYYYVAEFEQFGNMLIYCYVTKRTKKESVYVIEESELLSVKMKGRFRSKCSKN